MRCMVFRMNDVLTPYEDIKIMCMEEKAIVIEMLEAGIPLHVIEDYLDQKENEHE